MPHATYRMCAKRGTRMKNAIFMIVGLLAIYVQARGEIASGEGWTLSDDGVLTVERNFS